MSDTPNLDGAQTTESSAPPPLVRHSRREHWGRALMLWEREDKRAYQFEDGEVRVFAEPYFKFLVPAKRPDPVLRQELRAKAMAAGHIEGAKGRKKSERAKAAAGPVPNLDDQIAVFDELYPDAFHGTPWTEEHRERLQGRRLKKLRTPAVAEAKDKLAHEALQDCIDAGRHGEVVKRMVEVVGNTDLATSQQLAVFKELPEDKEIAEALVGYLHDQRQGDLATMARLRRALARHGAKKLSWTALTAPRALLHPQDHMCVRPSVVRAQAKLINPRFKPGPVPCAEDYARCLELVMGVQERLTKAGFGPRDLFDVTSFMKETLSASNKDRLQQAMFTRMAEEQSDKPPAE